MVLRAVNKILHFRVFFFKRNSKHDVRASTQNICTHAFFCSLLNSREQTIIVRHYRAQRTIETRNTIYDDFITFMLLGHMRIFIYYYYYYQQSLYSVLYTKYRVKLHTHTHRHGIKKKKRNAQKSRSCVWLRCAPDKAHVLLCCCCCCFANSAQHEFDHTDFFYFFYFTARADS